MFKIEDNILYLVKGDVVPLKVDLTNYKYHQNDTLTLTVKKDFGILAYISKTVPANQDIILSSADTENMDAGTYWYDIQLTLADGTIKTIVSANRMELVNEVTTQNDLVISDPSAKYVKTINNKYGDVLLTASDVGGVEASDLSQVAFSGDYEDLTNKPSFPEPYELPIASQTELGGVKIDGNTIVINDGIITAVGSTGDITAEDLKASPNFSWLYAGQTNTIFKPKECSNIEDVKQGLRKGLVLVLKELENTITIENEIWSQYYVNYYRPSNGQMGGAFTYGNIALANNIFIVPLGNSLLVGTRDNINLALRNSLKYDNSSSSLAASTIKDAIDELAARDANSINNDQLENILANKSYVNEQTLNNLLGNKQENLVSGVNIKTINGNSLLGTGNLILESGEGGSANWGNIGGDISEQEDLSQVLSNKQETLVSGVNIKTINGNDLIGSGNLIIGGGSGSSEWGSIGGTLSNQTDLITELNKKANTADLKPVATSGSYYDLTNRPTIPTQYVLPTASATVLGGIKVGAGLNIVNGVLSSTSASYSAGDGIKIENGIISLDLANADDEAY